MVDFKKLLGQDILSNDMVCCDTRLATDQHRALHYRQITQLKEGHNLGGFFASYFRRKQKKHHCLEEIVLASEYIYQTVDNAGGGTVLFLGRTPCLVQLAYEQVLGIEEAQNQRPVHLNYSGHPDAETVRPGAFYSNNPETVRVRNMVSPQKLSHYFSYLDSKEILSAKNLYIVDMLESGGALNSFIRLLNTYFQSKRQPMPDLNFLALSSIYELETLNENSLWSFEREGKSNSGILKFPSDKQRNIRPYSINTTVVHVDEVTLGFILDNDLVQACCVHGVEYPAQKWTPEYDEEVRNGGPYHEDFYKYLSVNYKNLVNWHKKPVALK